MRHDFYLSRNWLRGSVIDMTTAVATAGMPDNMISSDKAFLDISPATAIAATVAGRSTKSRVTLSHIRASPK